MNPASRSRIMGLILAFSALGLSAQITSAQDAAGGRPNLLTNGTFEKGLDGWKASAYVKKGEAVVDATEKREGKPTLKASNSVVDDLMVTQKVKVKPMTRYRITGYIKTKDIEPEQKGGKVGASLAISGTFEHSEMIQGKSWTKVSWEFNNAKATEIDIGPRLGHHGAMVSGTAWFADLTLVELGKARR